MKLQLPLTPKTIKSLTAGDVVYLNGVIYTGRDAAHQRLIEAIKAGRNLPFDLQNNILYYVGPTPAKPGEIIGSAGPTTSSRMDAYSPTLLDLGLKGMIGKGPRSDEVIASIIKNQAIYFAAVGGAAALQSLHITKSEIIAFEDLETEAIRRLEIQNFPVIVAIDANGKSLFSN